MRRYTIALLLGLVALAATACGGEDDGGGVASVGGDATETAAAEDEDLDPFEEALAYSECMRDNGIDAFPDPEQNGDGGISLGLNEDVDPESEEFKAAEEACEDLMPGPEEGETIDPEIYEALLAYSECMRENGISEFPDPEPGGGLRISGDMGFDTQSEEFQAAEEACEDLRPEGPEGGSGSNSEDG